MILHHEGIQLQKGYEPLESFRIKTVEPGRVIFSTLAGDFEVSAFSSGILRLRFPGPAQPDYGILAASPEDLPLEVADLPNGCQIRAGNLTLELFNGPLRIRLWDGSRLLLQSVTDRTIEGHLRFSPFARRSDSWLVSMALGNDEPIYGLGEKWASLNRRGQRIHSWNEDATTLNSELSYKNTPFAWSPEGWGLFTHTPSKVIHGVGYPNWSHRSYIFQVFDRELDLFFISAPDPAGLIERYTHLTGRAALPPRWSYGMWMSRAYYRTAEEALHVARTLRERQIPCDVLLLDGRAWHTMEDRFDFQWDPVRYPDPPAFVRQLRDLGIRLNLWEYSYLSTRNPLFNELADRGFFLKNPDGSPYIHRWFPWPYDKSWPHLMPSGILDFTNPEAYAWFRDQHQALFEIGVSVMKTDYGEAVPAEVVAYNGDSGARLHNIYTHLYNRCVYEAAKQYSQDEPMVWGRAAWAGGQRYPVQWGGDPQSDWEGLAASVRGAQAWGMSGGPFYAHDIGGFAVGNPEPELYVRWAQAGILCSHTRFHGLGEREPWVYGQEAEDIVRRWLSFRYRLIPYLQSLALQASQTGLPVVRSMVLAFPQDRLAWQAEQQYMLGDALLVAPVVVPGGKVRYYLPRGRWFDLWEQTWVEGPGQFERVMPLDRIPVFGREGWLLPLGPAVQHTGLLKPDLDLQEIWAFGTPRIGLQLPGIALQVDQNGRLLNLPAGVELKSF